MENEKRNFIAEHALLTEENFLLAAQTSHIKKRLCTFKIQ